VFWDADNVMASGYLDAVRRAAAAAPEDVAILYPDIQFCDEELRPRQLWTLPAYDYWRLRAETCADTASAWPPRRLRATLSRRRLRTLCADAHTDPHPDAVGRKPASRS
jgi:hypothetical protein